MNTKAQEYLNTFLDSLVSVERQKYTSFSADYFCGDEYNANVCAELIKKGIKTATCSMKYWYEQEGEPLPAVGNLQVVTNWQGNPTSIIEICAVSECKFTDVSDDFAKAEGEGDRSLAWWREAHWSFFSAECAEVGIKPTEDMLLVLEHFKVVHQ
ncbi:MAG: hypothetical protein ACI9LG_001014 [Moritella dasanensis]|jgi:uncharacterized protein YhfF